MFNAALKRLPEIQPIDVVFVALGVVGSAVIAATWTLGRLANTDIVADCGDD